jgi:hypothetical protein
MKQGRKMQMANKLNQKEINQVIKLVNEWFDSNNYLDDPNNILHKWLNQPNYFPEGHPWYRADFDWSGEKVPSFIWEGCGLEDWADKLCYELNPKLNKIGVQLEPYASWAVSIYKW